MTLEQMLKEEEKEYSALSLVTVAGLADCLLEGGERLLKRCVG